MGGRADVVEEVRRANEAFYEAFEALDIDRMAGVWAQGDAVSCVHPGWGILTGWEAVRASWEMIFQGTGEIRFTLTDVQIRHRDSIAWVTLTENILSEARGDLAATTVLSTNIFVKEGGRWRLVHHHASPIPSGPSRPRPSTLH